MTPKTENRGRLLIFRGLPASGKTTAALEMQAADPSIVRVNRDEIRLALIPCGCGIKHADHGTQGHSFESAWSDEKEKQLIAPERNRRIEAGLKAGLTVVSDDTNLAPKVQEELQRLAKRHGAEVEFRDFDTSIDDCIRRDAKRTGTARVGEGVIRGMYYKHLAPPKAEPDVVPYVPLEDAPWAILSDLDGTVADHTGLRSPYDGSKCDLDRPIEEVRMLLTAFVPTNHIIYVSGRDDRWRDKTLDWLCRHGFPSGDLYMRTTGDTRNDSVVKQEIFDAHIRSKWNIRFVCDDRPRVIRYWRAIGLFTFTVGDLHEF